MGIIYKNILHSLECSTDLREYTFLFLTVFSGPCNILVAVHCLHTLCPISVSTPVVALGSVLHCHLRRLGVSVYKHSEDGDYIRLVLPYLLYFIGWMPDLSKSRLVVNDHTCISPFICLSTESTQMLPMKEIFLDTKVISDETILTCELKVPQCMFSFRTLTEFGLDNVDA